MFKKRRQNKRRYRQEFQDLLDRKANGEEVDEDRMYCLEIFAHQHVGEELTEDKLLDLEDFKKEEKKAAAKSIAPSETFKKETSDDLDASAQARANDLLVKLINLIGTVAATAAGEANVGPNLTAWRGPRII